MQCARSCAIFKEMKASTQFLTISECAQRFQNVTESSLRRWIKSGKIPQEALLIQESTHKAGRMVTLIDVDQLKQVLNIGARSKRRAEAVASNGTNQVAGNWDQLKAPYEDFIDYLKGEVETQRLRAELAEERTQKAEDQLKLLTHQPPSESKADGTQTKGKKYSISDLLFYVFCGLMIGLLGFLVIQQFKYSI